MATCLLTYVFDLGEYFSRHGFKQGALSYLGESLRADAQRLMEGQLRSAGLPYVVRECSQAPNPCGLQLVGPEGQVIRELYFDETTGDASFGLPGDRRRCGGLAQALLAAVRDANQAFQTLHKTLP